MLPVQMSADVARGHGGDGGGDDRPPPYQDEMLRLQGLGSNTEMGVPYTEDEIMAIVRGGVTISFPRCLRSLSHNDGCGDDEQGDDEDDGEDGEDEDDS
ncbi:hypothetical protein Tco_1307731 [Tanacetum coccineum]